MFNYCFFFTQAENKLLAADIMNAQTGRKDLIEQLLGQRAYDENNDSLFFYDAKYV